jgi:hypothetical protein
MKTLNKIRKNRFDSFELSDSEQGNQVNLKGMIFELQSFFPSSSKEFSEIDKLIEESKLNEADEDDEDQFRPIPFYQVDFIAKVRRDMKCLEVLKGIRQMIEDAGNTSEVLNWDLLVKDGFQVQCYQTFIYSLIRLIDITSKDKINRDLAYNSGRTYLCLLGLPGAKRCLIWESEILLIYFKLFTIPEETKKSTSYDSYSDHYTDIQIMQMLGECKTVFNIVCLSDQEEILEKYVETVSSTLENFMQTSKNSSHEIIMKCYENFEALLLKPLPDKEIEAIMYLIFCRTVDLHFITIKRNSRSMKNAKHGESISDFFLYLLSTYSEKTKNVLLKFLKSLLSNPGNAHK